MLSSGIDCVSSYVNVQLQLAAGGEWASRVAGWLHDHYEHVACSTRGQPGLTVLLTVPDVEEGINGWSGSFVATTAALDLALEILAGCFQDLQIPAMPLLSLHLSAASRTSVSVAA